MASLAASRAFGALIGRDADVARIDALFAEGRRAITILGPGGAGKTRLALEYARSREAEREGSAYLCDLSDVRDAAELWESIGRTLGLTAHDDAPAQVIGRALEGRPSMLLVLDNAEQVASLVANAIDVWLAGAPNARFLTTSRERLGHREEALLWLEPLAIPGEAEEDVSKIGASAAVRLFVDRARLVDPTFALDHATATDVSAIVRGVDGVPLAIELAAARVGVLGVAELRTLLGRRLDLFSDRAKSRHPRHATIRATIDWSWSMLSDAEQSALAQCSVFRGGFSRASAQNVLVGPTGAAFGELETIELLQALHDKSLLRTYEAKRSTSERRYALYQVVEDYVGEKLDALGSADTRRRHALFFAGAAVAWLEESRSGRHGALPARFEAELENLISASDHLVRESSSSEDIATGAEALIATQSFFLRSSSTRFTDRMSSLLRLLEARAPHTLVTARAHAAQGHVLVRRERWNEASEHFRAALAHGLDDRSGAARVYAVLGFIAIWRDKHQEAEDLLDEAERRVCGSDPEVEALVARYRGILLRQKNDFEGARHELSRALQIFRDLALRGEEGQVLGSLGNLARQLADLERARQLYRDAVDAAREGGDLVTVTIQLVSLGTVLQELGQLDAARDAFDEAASIERSIGAWSRAAVQLGVLALEQGKFAEAIPIFRSHASRIEKLVSTSLLGYGLAYWAAAEALLGQLDDAESRLDRAQSLFEGARSEPGLEALLSFRAQVTLGRAKEAALQGRSELARALLMEARRRADSPLATPSEAGRFAQRLLRKAIADLLRSGDDWTLEDDVLVVEEQGRWFRTPRGERVEIAKFKASATILSILARQRVAVPSMVVSTEALIGAAWPGERIRSDAALARLQSAVSKLRKLGLTAVLHRDGAYLLDGDIPVRIVANPPPPASHQR